LEFGEGEKQVGGELNMRSLKTLCSPIKALLVAASMMAAGGLLGDGVAKAERTVQIGGAKRTATVSVYIGKSEDVRTDTSFVEITVGDRCRSSARRTAPHGCRSMPKARS
jgi:hypothetical protein